RKRGGQAVKDSALRGRVDMRVRELLLVFTLLPLDGVLAAQPDPLQSVMWQHHHERVLNGEPYVFDDHVKVLVPPFAEDARQVPMHVDARALSAQRARIDMHRYLAGELNPIPRV